MLLTPVIIERLEALIEVRNTDQKNVALAAGLSDTAARNILKGRSKNPGVETLAALAGVLGVSVAYLIGETDTPGDALCSHAPPPTRQPVQGFDLTVNPPNKSVGIDFGTPEGEFRVALTPEQTAYLRWLCEAALDDLARPPTETKS